jgi:hypothetical protein
VAKSILPPQTSKNNVSTGTPAVEIRRTTARTACSIQPPFSPTSREQQGRAFRSLSRQGLMPKKRKTGQRKNKESRIGRTGREKKKGLLKKGLLKEEKKSREAHPAEPRPEN